MTEVTEVAKHRSAQELFNDSLNAIIKQGKGSFTPYGGCKYLGPDNTGCAVGILIKDKNLCAQLDSTEDVATTGVNNTEIINQLPEELQPHIGLLIKMQIAHDCSVNSADFISAFMSNMKTTAQMFNLDFNPQTEG